ncbi:hypothetical protein [Dethiobacter alkaliphilus]|uniref:hypothetical protein n=1 Tax=Dethiobacter alkaliphilus TaxID=427926 RepID=UPI0022273195|nr:hypothetical protein [Dethiobacter alkaliphilus]MCW3488787.1 hypothetical protein [Dethiobacter alkaliphilus]
MLKWDTQDSYEEPLKVPKFFNWLTGAVITGAFAYVFYLWFRWLTLLGQHNQSLLFWLQS